ncbi:MAG TPA: T9SS type A sorting domain-containing protein, partial [Bacteroidia bacterium]|nr:T9SS type A sorting domain-containing protein [Bacteroidia bacterium]
SAMGGSMILEVTSHITVSRSKDGSKIFYGWADSDPNVTLQTYNINPDILMKAYDVNTGMASATINATGGLGTCFYPFLSDISYNDGTNWVVPAVFTVGHGVPIATSPQTTYDASAQADYYFTNCGTFNPTSDFTVTPTISTATPSAPCITGIATHNNNAFEGSISNYPNPFNNTTTIAVTLTENKNVDVKVYNAIGTLVFSKKVNGNVGENTVSFDGSALSSGVYYYTVTAGNQQATKKMIIQK